MQAIEETLGEQLLANFFVAVAWLVLLAALVVGAEKVGARPASSQAGVVASGFVGLGSLAFFARYV